MIEALLIEKDGNTRLLALPSLQKLIRFPVYRPLLARLQEWETVPREPLLSCKLFRWVPPAQRDETDILVYLYEEA